MSIAVSIISISKDDPAGLQATVTSAIKQSFTDFEIIVVRSGSSAGANLPEDPRIRVIDDTGRGISNALNCGLHVAQGEWVQFLNGGDVYSDAASLARLMSSSGSAVQMICSFAEIAGRAFTIPRRELRCGRDSFLYISHQATLFHRQLFAQFGGFSSEHRIHMDLEWLARLPGSTRFEFIPITTVRFDTGGVSDALVVCGSMEEARILWASTRYRPRAVFVLIALLPFRVIRRAVRSVRAASATSR